MNSTPKDPNLEQALADLTKVEHLADYANIGMLAFDFFLLQMEYNTLARNQGGISTKDEVKELTDCSVRKQESMEKLHGACTELLDKHLASIGKDPISGKDNNPDEGQHS